MIGSIEKIIDVSCQKCNDAAVDDVGTAAEILPHLTGTVFGVNVDGAFPKYLLLFLDDERNVKAAVGKTLGGAVHGNAATLEIEIAQCAGQTFIKNRGQQIALELLGNHCSLARHCIKCVAMLVDALLADQLAVQHLVERFRKIEIHDIIVLHNDVVDGYKIQGIVDVAHQIENEDLDVVHASDG